MREADKLRKADKEMREVDKEVGEVDKMVEVDNERCSTGEPRKA